MIVEDTVFIDASPAFVWAVTEEVERWPEWTPTVSHIQRLDDRPFGLGSRTLIKQPGQSQAEWVVTDYRPGERFTWEMQRTGMRMAATHELLPENEGTRNVLRLVADGIVAVLLSPVLRPLVRKALSTENAGLKARCEGTSSSMP